MWCAVADARERLTGWWGVIARSVLAALAAALFTVILIDPAWWLAGLAVAGTGLVLWHVAVAWSWKRPLERWKLKITGQPRHVLLALESLRYQETDWSKCVIKGPISGAFREDKETEPYPATPRTQYAFTFPRPSGPLPDGRYTVRWVVAQGRARFTYKGAFAITDGEFVSDVLQ